jgi:hypothetical protein
MVWLAIIFDRILPSTQTDAEVSSQEDSMASKNGAHGRKNRVNGINI